MIRLVVAVGTLLLAGGCAAVSPKQLLRDDCAVLTRPAAGAGLDIETAGAASVLAPVEGVVVASGRVPGGGTRVILYHGRHDDAHLYSGYYRLRQAAVAPGAIVQRGENLGTVAPDDGGRAGGLHIRVWRSQAGDHEVTHGNFWVDDAHLVDPLAWLNGYLPVECLANGRAR